MFALCVSFHCEQESPHVTVNKKPNDRSSAVKYSGASLEPLLSTHALAPADSFGWALRRAGGARAELTRAACPSLHGRSRHARVATMRVQEIQTADCAQESAAPAAYQFGLHNGGASKPPNAADVAEIAASRKRNQEYCLANPPTAEQMALLRKLVGDGQSLPEP